MMKEARKETRSRKEGDEGLMMKSKTTSDSLTMDELWSRFFVLMFVDKNFEVQV